MATVPSGYWYWDSSASKVYKAGETMPAVGEGDLLYTSPHNPALLSYVYWNAETYTYVDAQESPTKYHQCTVPAGWTVSDASDYTMTTAAPFSSINGAPVVRITWESANKISTLTVHSNLRLLVVKGSNTNIQTINGSVSSNLLYCNFCNCQKLRSVPSLAPATQIIYGKSMFYNCPMLTSVPALPPNIEVIQGAFKDCTSLVTAPAIPSKVLWAGQLFMGCTSLIKAPVNNSRVMQYIWSGFDGCSNLTDASDFYFPSTLTEEGTCFRGCTKLTSPPSVIRGTNALAYRMFQECSSLVTPPIMEGTFTNCNTMFYKCYSLKTPPVFPDTVTQLAWAFAECTSLTEIPKIPENVESLYYCFYKCESLTWISTCLPSIKLPNMNYMFNGCKNLTGIIFYNDKNNTGGPPHNKMFTDTEKTIVLGGLNGSASTYTQLWANTANNNNVYVGLFAVTEAISAVRTDINGTPNDKGEYVRLTIEFTAPVIDYTKLYVPKVYIENAQQQPIKNWVLTYVDEQGDEITKEIPDSTDIEATRIEVGDLIAKGKFVTMLEASDDGAVYTASIPTSCSQVTYDYDENGDYIVGTRYWGGKAGKAIFTGSTYIFDALPDGSAFKIGGPVSEDAGEKGFIVGNIIEVEEDQYPSTFNGPSTFNSKLIMGGNVVLRVDNTQASGTTEGDLYLALKEAGFVS